jgi:ATP-dependent DNA ligase
VLHWPVEPMRAAAVTGLPPAPRGRELIYQPKWDGFRAVVWIGPDRVAVQSRHGRDLTGYFPDVCQTLADHLPSAAADSGTRRRRSRSRRRGGRSGLVQIWS